MTLVVRKRANVPPEVTAGLETVGVRVPAHPVAQALLRAAQVPIAAPSANLFGRPSPTRAQHVLDDLQGRIDVVLDGGPTSVGVESTIVDVSRTPPRLLRPGGLEAEAIEAVLGSALASWTPAGEGPQTSPGQLSVHYSPRTPLTLIAGPPGPARERLIREVEASLAAGRRVGVLAVEEDLASMPSAARVGVVGAWAEPATVASRLFEAMRTLDAANLDVLMARDLADPASGLGRALADRLRRAAHRVIDVGSENYARA